jgi:hypothetical protein
MVGFEASKKASMFRGLGRKSFKIRFKNDADGKEYVAVLDCLV